MYDVTVVLSLFVAIAALVPLANGLAVPYPILLVIGGLILGFVPGLPRITLRPDLVFLVFLPPLLYWDAVTTSWREFRANLPAISRLAIGLVIFTTCGVAVVAHALISGLSWPLAFVLGAIVSPTDAVATAAIADRLGLPTRIVAILEGESLVNDATAIVVYGTAITAVVRGTFSLPIAALEFVGASVGGMAIGLTAGLVIAALRHRMEDPLVESTVSLLTPFVAYLPADLIGASGVLAAVTAGLYIGRQVPTIVSSSTRLVTDSLWSVLTFLLNGLSFILIGLQLHGILGGLVGRSIATLLWHGVVISLAVILIRIIWVAAVAFLERLLRRLKAVPDPLPSGRQRAVIAWAGMRGVVSLATAMALPLTTNHGTFPHRDLLVYLTFCVIFATLVLQGLSLPRVIRWLGVAADGSAAQEELKARLAAARAALSRLNVLAAGGTLPAPLVDNFRQRFTIRVQRLQTQADDTPHIGDAEQRETYFEIRQELMAVERRTIISMRNRNEISDSVLRRIQRDLDLEEAQLLPGRE